MTVASKGETPDFSNFELPGEETNEETHEEETFASFEEVSGADVGEPDELDGATEELEEDDALDEQREAGLLDKIAQANPYTVVLGLSLVALVIATVCLWRELVDYNYEMKVPKEVGKPVSLAPADLPVLLELPTEQA
ncbi:MAG: hypothetical protein HQ581_01240 [Planctomycetes bacterium]|nr:hypothetical protein [Planctomycetota bacterium]